MISEILSRKDLSAFKRLYLDHGGVATGNDLRDLCATIDALALGLGLAVGKAQDISKQITEAVAAGKRDTIEPDLIQCELDRMSEGWDASHNSDHRDKTTFEVIANLREKGWLS